MGRAMNVVSPDCSSHAIRSRVGEDVPLTAVSENPSTPGGIVKLTLSERTHRVELTSFALIGRHRLPPARRRKRGLVAPDDDALATNAVRRERDFARVHAQSRIVAPAQEL